MRYEARVKKLGKFNGLRLGYVYAASASEAGVTARQRWPDREIWVEHMPIEDTADEIRKRSEYQIEEHTSFGAF